MPVQQAQTRFSGSVEVSALAESPQQLQQRMGMTASLIQIRARQQAEKEKRMQRYAAYRFAKS